MFRAKQGRLWNRHKLYITIDVKDMFKKCNGSIAKKQCFFITMSGKIKNCIDKMLNVLYHEEIKSWTTEGNKMWEGKDKGVVSPEQSFAEWSERNTRRHKNKN